MATKQEIATATRKRFLTKEVVIADDVKVTLRELPGPEMAALNKRLFETDAEGELVVEKDRYVSRKGAHVVEEWLAVAMDPAFTVEELLSADWPESLKLDLRREAAKLNGFTFADAVGNS